MIFAFGAPLGSCQSAVFVWGARAQGRGFRLPSGRVPCSRSRVSSISLNQGWFYRTRGPEKADRMLDPKAVQPECLGRKQVQIKNSEVQRKKRLRVI